MTIRSANRLAVPVVLAFSLVTNVGLVAYILLGAKDTVSTTPPQGARTILDSGANETNSILSARIEKLRSLGVSESDLRWAIVGLVRSEVMPQPAQSTEYWTQERQSSLAASAVAAQDARDQVAAQLVLLFGKNAESFPEFTEFFRPLDYQYPFLSPSEQRAVAKRRLQRQLDRSFQSSTTQRVNPPNGGGVPWPSVGPPAVRVDDYSDLLSSGNALEFAMRESALATQLRSADAGFTEQEYRNVFIAIRDADSNGRSIDMRALSKHVSKDRIVAALAVRDPALRTLRDVAARHQLPIDPLFEAFDVYMASAHQMSTVAGAGQGQGQGQGQFGPRRLGPTEAARLRSIQTDRDTSLNGILGADLASEFLVAIRTAMRMTGTTQDGTPLRQIPGMENLSRPD